MLNRSSSAKENASYEGQNQRRSKKMQQIEQAVNELSEALKNYLLLSGGTVTGTLILSRTTDASGAADNGPALIIGSRAGAHLEIDNNEIMAKSNGTTTTILMLNVDGGGVTIGKLNSDDITFIQNKLRFCKTLSAYDGVNSRTIIQVMDDGDTENYGSELIIGASGNLYIGSGESPAALYDANGVSSGEVTYITSDNIIQLVTNCNAIANRKTINISGAALYPAANGAFTLGTGSLRWGQIYSTASAISTSDQNQKHDILCMDEKRAEALIAGLKPVTYKYNDGTSDRTHWGLIAQDIEELLDALGIDPKEFAGFIKSKKEKIVDKRNGEMGPDLDADGNAQYEYGLRYEEFIAPLIKTVQMQRKQIASLEGRIAKLENRMGGDNSGLANA